MKDSRLFTWNLKDFAKGMFIAVLGAALGIIKGSLDSGSLHFNWPLIGSTALLTAVAYLAKNFLTNSKDQILTKEP